MSRKNMLFKKNNAEETKKEFLNFLETRDLWFGTILYGIKEGWIKQGCSITEILIREHQPIALGILKAYIPCNIREGDAEFIPTKHHILSLVEKFTDRSPGAGSFMGESIDFAFQVFGLGIFRVNFSNGNEGCSLSIRFLPFSVPKLEEVGYPPIYLDFLKSLTETTVLKSPPIGDGSFFIQLGEGNNPSMEEKPKIAGISTKVPRSGGGLILHLGPTGSGKTTAMAAEIDFIATQTSALILTYEDPIEFAFIGTMSPVASFELGRDIKEGDGFTLPEMVQRHSLRKNPAVIMFGEMRTTEQMRMVVDMANRGHWVFASMHGQNIDESISVLAAIFKDEPFVLANSLKAAVAHRLVTNMRGDIVPLFEIFIPDQTRTDALAKGDLDEIKRVFKDGLGNQSISFKQSLDYLVEKGKISGTEIDRITKMAFGTFDRGEKK